MTEALREHEVVLRLATPADEAFLFEIYAASRSDEFAALGWDPVHLDLFLKMQFDMRRRSYLLQTPNAETMIAEVDGRPAATLMIDRRGETVDLVDIAVTPEMRGRGLATLIIRRLMSDAKRIDLTVEVGNAAATRLYERLGFTLTEAGGVYNKMVWEARN